MGKSPPQIFARVNHRGRCYGDLRLVTGDMNAASYGVYAAVLVGSIWRHATHLTSRALLLTYLTCIAFALALTGASALAGVAASYAVGFCAVGLTKRLLRRLK
jgi:hypothetical protein